MKRLTRLFPPALARFAFWRKPAAPDVAQAESDPLHAPAEQDASPETSSETPPGWLTRFRRVFRRRRPDNAEASTARLPDETDAAEASRPRFLAKLAGRLRRQAAASPAATVTDEALDENPRQQGPPDKDGEAASPRGLRRIWALVSCKRIWIPAAGVAVLALVGTLGVLLWQATHEQTLLKTRVHAAEKKLERASPAAGIAKAPAVAPRPATEPLVTAATVAPAPPARSAGGDCDINSKEGVSLHLKDCIDAFNQETTRAGPGSR